MRILGVDPGLGITGYGIIDVGVEGPELIEAGEIKSKTSLPLQQRLSELYDGLKEVANEFRPDAVAIEELYSNYKHPRTAVIMGHARGVLFLVAGKADIPVFSYSSTRVKKSMTGMGHASKDQVARMVSQILNFDEIEKRSDVTDAIAVALCHINAVSHGDIS